MQIVIELSEENVEKIKNVKSDFMFLDLYEIMKRSINNGIALPASHGRLIDENALIEIFKSRGLFGAGHYQAIEDTLPVLERRE